MELQEYSTSTLVDELRNRAGVETVVIEPYDQTYEVVKFDKKTSKYLFDQQDTGPAVILIVID